MVQNPEGNKYCGQCGFALDAAASSLRALVEETLKQQLEAAFDARFKDGQVVQVEITEAIAEKLSNWARMLGFFIGVPITVLLLVLGFLGYSKFSDFSNLVEDRKSKLESLFNARQTQVDAIRSKGDDLNREYQDLESRLPYYKSLGQRLEELDRKQGDLAKKVEQVERLTFKPSRSLTPQLERKLKSALSSFQGYFQKLGFKPNTRDISVSLEPKVEHALAYYDPGQNTMYVDSRYADDVDLMYREYTHHVLSSTNKALMSGIRTQSENWYFIESALATYFPCSFSRKPAFGDLRKA